MTTTQHKKTIAQLVDEHKKVDVTIDYTYKGITVTQQLTCDEEGDHDWQIYNPVQGWSHSYYQGWSYQKADQNEEADIEQILVDAVQYSDNMSTILDVVWDSYDNEEHEDIILVTDDSHIELFELDAPEQIEVTMLVTAVEENE